ncbi:MAG TPA: Gfo/Idh/MocA family oxidoreductase [Anaerolineales bacterium]|nr:Gfo/Idh/MocA family oxidoreductase [Anaerolineales bacterium]
MRTAICGLGSIGRRHLDNLHALGEQDVVLVRSGKGSLGPEGLDGYPVEADLQSALERWEPEAVLVTNPTALHLDAAIPAASAGCHIFLEKPVSHSLDRVDELRRALAKGGGRLLVGHQFRLHPGLRSVRSLVQEGAIGAVLSARAHWGEHLPGWHPWEDYRRSYSARPDLGGGALLTLSHPFDYLRWILGEVSAVSAQIGVRDPLGLEVDASAEVVLEFEAGTLASVHLDYHQQPPRHDLLLIGERGTIEWGAAGGAVRWWTTERGDWVEEAAPEGFERNSMFLEEMRHFRQVVREEAEPACTLEDGIAALQIALAARRSAGVGRRIELRVGEGSAPA